MFWLILGILIGHYVIPDLKLLIKNRKNTHGEK